MPVPMMAIRDMEGERGEERGNAQGLGRGSGKEDRGQRIVEEG